MSSTSEGRGNNQTRTYDRAESIVFLKTKEAYGGLSNMAGGFPLRVNGIRIPTSEALYQACRFPHLPEVQKIIIQQKSPMTAKMKSKPHRRNARPDWDHVRVNIMRWCLRVKLAQNWTAFSKLLLETGKRPIVEQSRKDDFWGAKPVGEHTLVGMNVLGRLLMELREAVKVDKRETLLRVKSLSIPDFLLNGHPIGMVTEEDMERVALTAPSAGLKKRDNAVKRKAMQASLLFDAPAAKKLSSPDHSSERTKAIGIADLKPYPKMKDSGVPWLGEVPEHWDVVPLCAIARTKSITGQQDRELLSVYLDLGVISFSDVKEKRTNVTSEDLSKYQAVDPGDFVLNNQQAWRGSVGVSGHSGIVSPAYLVLSLDSRINSEFANLLFRERTMVAQYLITSKGVGSIQRNLYWPHLKRVSTFLPPLPEQAAIAHFLDYADQRIGRYIRAKQRLIKLLEEQKQVIINRAVTRGLDPNVRLKPSGVDWLGDFPEHWEIRRLKFLAKNVNVQTNSKLPEEAYVALEHVESWSGRITLPDDEVTFDSQVKRFKSNDVLFGKLRPYLAKVTRPQVSGVCVGEFLVLRAVEPHILPEFLEQKLRSKQLIDIINRSTFGAKMPRASWTFIGSLLVTYPPTHEEQKAILNQICERTTTLRAALDRAQGEISLLREYRTRLIADVVTGKLDVNEAAARLPDEQEEPEPLDDLETLVENDEKSESSELELTTEEG